MQDNVYCVFIRISKHTFSLFRGLSLLNCMSVCLSFNMCVCLAVSFIASPPPLPEVNVENVSLMFPLGRELLAAVLAGVDG